MSDPAPDILIANIRFAGPATRWRPQQGWVGIRGGQIACVGGLDQPEPAAAQRIDGQGGVLLPGLRNAHTHGSEILLRGAADGLGLEAWLAAVWRRLDTLSPDQVAIAIRFNALLSLKSGVTRIVDHLRRTPMTDEVLEGAADAYAETGLRALVAVMLRDRMGSNGAAVGAPHITTCEPPAMQVDRVRRVAESRTTALLSFALGPSASVRSTDALLEAIADTANAAGLPVHVHAAESRAEVEEERSAFGVSPFGRLHRAGLLGPRTACAHAVWTDAQDVAMIAEGGAAIVHNPVSNLRLGSGIADVPAFVASGIPVAVGTDGAVSNDGVDVWEALKFAYLLPRRDGFTRTPLTPEEMLDMACATGADALGGGAAQLFPAPGAEADCCLYPAVGAPFPDADLFPSALILAGPGRPSLAMVHGEILLRDGHSTRLDEDRVVAEAMALSKDLLS